MRLRTLLTTAVVGTLIAGATGMTAQATPVSSPTRAGTVVAWGDTSNAQAAGALAVPNDLTAPVAALATTSRSTAAVTVDGQLRVWGVDTAAEVTEAPTDVTDAVAVALSLKGGLVLHRDGTVTGWGTTALAEDVPADLRAKAITIDNNGTAYAVTTTGELDTWGAAPVFPMPDGLTNLVDVADGGYHVVALKADGTIVTWRYESSNPAEDAYFAALTDVPDFGTRKVVAIDVSSLASAVVLDDGSIEVWGVTVPTDEEPDFGSAKVISLDVAGANAGAVTDDGTVYTWGSGSSDAAIETHPGSLANQPAASIVVGDKHAAVIITSFRALTAPTVVGTPQVGQTLTGTPATFSLTPSSPATGQWYADAAPIVGQTGTTLALDESMVGKKITYRTSATRDGETVTSTSNEVGPVTAVPHPSVDNPAAKADSKITKVKVKATGKTKKVAKKVKVAITVKTAKGVSPKGKVAVALKGKTKKKAVAKVNAKGKATVVVKKVKRGKYQVKLKYRGNADVAPAKKTVKAKV